MLDEGSLHVNPPQERTSHSYGETAASDLSLEEQSAFLSTLLATSPKATAFIDSAFIIRVANEAFSKETSRPLKESLGHSTEEVFQNWTEGLGRICEEVRANGKSIHLEAWPLELKGRPDRDIRYQGVSLSPIQGIGGRFLGYLFVLGQEVGQKRAEEERERLLAQVDRKQQELSQVVESIVDEVWFCDEKGNIVLANAAARRFGQNAGQDSLQPLDNLIANLEVYDAHGRPRPREGSPLLRALAGETISDLEEIVVFSRSGEKHFREASASPIKDSADRILGAVAVVRDITERRSMRAKFSWLAEVVESSSDAITSVDLDGKIVSWNKGAEGLYGYTAEEAKGRPVSIICPPDRHDEVLAAREKVHRGEEVEPFETVRLRKDGTLIDISMRISPVKDTAGRIIGSSGTARNITERKQMEEDLRQRERELRTLLDSLPAYVVFKDLNGTYITANQKWCESVGCHLSELPGKSIYDVYPKDLADKFRRDDLRVLETGEALYVGEEEEIVGNERITVETYKSPLKDEGGAVIGLIALSLDLTERKRAEQMLRQHEREVVTLLDSLPGYAFFKDTSGRYVMVNQQYCDGMGLSKDEIIGKTDYDLYPEALAECYRASDGAVLEREGPVFAGEEEALGHGRPVPVLTRKVPLRDDSGAVIGLIGLAFDISERKAMEQTLKESEERYRLLADNAQDVIFRFERKPRRGYSYVSPSVTVLTGYTPEDHYTDPDLPSKIVYPEDRHLLKNSGSGASAPQTLTWRLQHKDGHIVWAEQRTTPIYDEHRNLVATEGIVRDVTEQVQARKRLEELDQMKDEFLSLVAHELRTPLTGLKGYCQTALRRLNGTADHQPEVKALQIVNAQADRMANLIKELLDISRIEQGRLEFLVGAFDLGELSSNVVQLLQVTTKRHELRFSAKETVKVWADQDRVEQVLFNLLHNAIKFSPYGGLVQIDLTKQTDRALVSVKDYGFGIPREKQAHLFDRFYQAHDVGKAFGGLGIGLYISREIVSKLGGEVWMESEEGKGSTFFFTLPLA